VHARSRGAQATLRHSKHKNREPAGLSCACFGVGCLFPVYDGVVLQATLSSLDVRALSDRAHVTATIRSLAKQRTGAAAEKKRLTGILSLMAPNWQLKHQRPLLYRGIE
jgi:hypothetical protein